jgi:hypothetical protein
MTVIVYEQLLGIRCGVALLLNCDFGGVDLKYVRTAKLCCSYPFLI